MYDVRGIDVSRHQGELDFEEIEASGIRFCIVKASEGADYMDPGYSGYATALASIPARIDSLGALRGLAAGAYHFARPDNRVGQGEAAGRTEAEWHVRVVESDLRMLTMGSWLDWEKWPKRPFDEMEAWIHGFVNRYEELTGLACGIYTGPNTWEGTTGNSLAFDHHRLWTVKYQHGGPPPPDMPKGIGGWPWSLHQWSGGGRWAYGPDIPGTNGPVDQNVFNGTEREFCEAIGLAGRPPLPAHGVGILATIDLAKAGTFARHDVAIVQGLMLSNGKGPDGLVGGDGRPDGIAGQKTLAAADELLGTTEVGPAEWHRMLSPTFNP